MEKTLIFKKLNGEIVENVEKYVKDWIKENPYGQVIIGCDSQIHGRRIKYSVAIVMHYVDLSGLRENREELLLKKCPQSFGVKPNTLF